MKILMTGATGLIGRAFIQRYSNHQFTIVSRTPTKAQQRLPTVENSLASLDQLPHLNDFDAVINLAGEPIIDKRWSAQQKHIIQQSRWQTTQQLVDLFNASSEPPSVFISGSAIGIYGDSGDQPLTEQTAIHAIDFASALCQQWEAIAQQAAAKTRVVCVRTGIVLSTDGGALKKMLLPFKLGLGGKIGNGRQVMSWIHIDDHIRALDYLLHQSISGPVNLTAPEPLNNQEFTRTLAKALKRPALLPAPAFGLKLALGESACLLLDSQYVVPKTLVQSGFEFDYPELSSALAALV